MANHYIRIDEKSRIVKGISDELNEPEDGDILVSENGGRQFQLPIGGGLSEENPPLTNDNGVYLYKWSGGKVKHRTQQEIYADAPEPPEPSQAEAVRNQRNRMLDALDWTQLLDAPITPESQLAVRVYRQELRDITEQDGFPDAVAWPEMPPIEKGEPDPVDEAFDALTGGDGDE